MISVDTGILLGILRGEPSHRQADILALSGKHPLVICDAAFAELCTAFPNYVEAQDFLDDHNIRVVMPSAPALCEAGKRFKAFLLRRQSTCPGCKQPVPYRGVTAVDFLVGALGVVDGSGVLTNDRQIKKSWPEALFL